MIAYLKGRIIWQQENQIIINVNNVGYQVEVTTSNIVAKNKEVELYIYTYVKEDRFDLYGFETLEEKELFVVLLGVSGIGPKAAVNIISTLSYDSFINAILTENVAVLKQISGIGPKTAQRLILELKSKVEKLAFESDRDLENMAYDQELQDALLTLGYSAKEIENTLAEIDFDDKDSIEIKIKKALSYLARER
ncbi:MAG: Holliday junction branch migration protein RuvA [bacterium]